jgi:hypothetical protein
MWTLNPWREIIEDASNDDDDGTKGFLESVSIRASDRRNELEIPLLLLSVRGVVQYIAHHRSALKEDLQDFINFVIRK